MIDWNDVEKTRKWSEKYYRSLSKAYNDIILFESIEGKIYVAMDFYDLYEHCFPNLKLLIQDSSSKNKANFLRRQGARYALFHLFKNIYIHPILILPPHFNEFISLINKYEKRINRGMKNGLTNNNFEDIKQYIESILSSYSQEGNQPTIELINKMQDDSHDLAFLFSPCFMAGLRGLRGLFTSDIISPVLSDIDRDKYFRLLIDINMRNNKDNEEIINRWATNISEYRADKRVLQNKNDAKSLQYLQGLNEIIDKDDVLIFISSDKLFHIQKFERDFKYKKFIPKLNMQFPLIRNMYPIYILLIEICNQVAIKKLDRIKDDRNILIDIQKDIELDMETLSKCLTFSDISAFVTLSGIFNTFLELILYNSIRLKSIINQRDRSAMLMLVEREYMRDFMFNWHTEFIQELSTYYNTLKQQMQSTDFSEILLKRIIEFDREKKEILEYLRTIPYSGAFYSKDPQKIESYINIFLFKSEELSLEYLQMLFEEKDHDFPENAQLFEIKTGYMWVLYNSNIVNKALYYIQRQEDQKYYIYILHTKYLFIILNIILEGLKQNEITIEEVKKEPLLEAMQEKIMPIIYKDNINFENKHEIQELYNKLKDHLGWNLI